jgi:hypothetical protein
MGEPADRDVTDPQPLVQSTPPAAPRDLIAAAAAALARHRL